MDAKYYGFIRKNNIWIQNAKFDIVSEDYEFPKNEKLRDKLWKEIRENKTIIRVEGDKTTELLRKFMVLNITQPVMVAARDAACGNTTLF